MAKITKLILIFLTLLNIFLFIFNHKQDYLRKYDAEYWSNQYEGSQWNKGWFATTYMTDAEHYAWNGWHIINGGDPDLINRQGPPLAKYFIGLSILIFNNENIISLFWGSVTLVILFFLARILTNNTIKSLSVVFLFSLDKLFLEQLNTSMLDLPFAFLLLLTIYFFIKSQKDNKYMYFSVVTLFISATSKVYPQVGVFGLILILYLLINKKFELFFKFLKAIPIGIIVYLLIYFPYFRYHNLKEFAYLHFWIVWFARNQVPNYHFFEIWRTYLFGQWLSWTPNPPDTDFILKLEPVKQWNIFWFIGGGITSIRFVYLAINRIFSENEFLIVSIIVGYLMFWSLTLPYPRYLLPILPLTYIEIVLVAGKLGNSLLKYTKKAKIL